MQRKSGQPDARSLAAAHARTGWQPAGIRPVQGDLLQPGGTTLDLSGIAKGFAVDHGVEALRALGLTDLLFEIGGELRGIGRRPDGQPWRVRVDGESPAAQRIALADMAIATSGDRWHRREHEGRRWSHTIDPRNGEPVAHALASVTVLHAQCMQADALATVLTVLGPDDGLAFAERTRSRPCSSPDDATWRSASHARLARAERRMSEAMLRALGAGATAAAYAALCLAVYARQRRQRTAAVREAARSRATADTPPTLVLFASQTGQAETIAWQTARQLRAAGTPVRVMELNALDAATLASATARSSWPARTAKAMRPMAPACSRNA
jgi:hypothetical protein